MRFITAPTISVEPGNECAVITWEEIPEATGYNLYWGTSPDINLHNMFTMKVPLVSSPFTQVQLANGNKYYFIVQSFNNKVSSYASNVASATPRYPIIRPFGDSITFGVGFADNTYCPIYMKGQLPCPNPPVDWGGGYRSWMTLIAKHDQNYLFTTEGHQNGGSNLMQQQMSTRSHDGYPGYRTDQMMDKSTLPSKSDITLVHLGTNDIYQGYLHQIFGHIPLKVSPFTERLFTLITNLLAANSKTEVHVAKIIYFAVGTFVHLDHLVPINAFVAEYNQQITDKWNALPQEKKDRVKLVDMANVLTDAADYTADGVHPSKEGYLKMSCSWIRSIEGMPANAANPVQGITTKAVIDLMPSQPQ